jgi:hypothetical protein
MSKIPTHSTPPTLSLQIPFHLLGTHTLPSNIYSHASRHKAPLHILRNALNKSCPEVLVKIWIPKAKPVLSDKESGGDREGGGQEGVTREGGMSYSERKLASQVELEEEIRRWREGEEKRWEKMKENNWILRRAEEGLGLVGWKDGDGELTPRQAKLLGDELWSFQAVLQRFGVEISRTERERLDKEVRMIDHCMWETFGYSAVGFDRGDKRKDDKNDLSDVFRVVCNERCWMKIGVHAPTTVDKGGIQTDDLSNLSGIEDEGGSKGWPMETIAKTLLILVAFERESLLLTTSSAILDYWPLSRFLEYVAVKTMKREKKEAWHALRVRDRKSHVKTTEEKRDKLWMNSLEHGHGEAKAFEDDLPGLWTAVDKMFGAGRGERGITSLLHEMSRFEGKGGRTLVSFGQSNENTDYEQPTVSSVQSTSIVFHGYNSTLNAEELLAYIDFVACVMEYATSQSYDLLRLKVRSFRETAEDIDEKVEKSLERLLEMLDVRPYTKKVFITDVKRKKEQKEKEREELDRLADDKYDLTEDVKKTIPRKQDDLFTPLETLLHKVLDKEMDYMPTFIQRYGEAGGFHIIPRTKVHDLLLASSLTRRTSNHDINETKGGKGYTASWVEDLRSEGAGEEYEVGPSGLVAASHMSSAPVSRVRSPVPHASAASPPNFAPPAPPRLTKLRIRTGGSDASIDEGLKPSPRPGDGEEDWEKKVSGTKISKLAERFTANSRLGNREWEKKFEERRRRDDRSPMRR